MTSQLQPTRIGTPRTRNTTTPTTLGAAPEPVTGRPASPWGPWARYDEHGHRGELQHVPGLRAHVGLPAAAAAGPAHHHEVGGPPPGVVEDGLADLAVQERGLDLEPLAAGDLRDPPQHRGDSTAMRAAARASAQSSTASSTR